MQAAAGTLVKMRRQKRQRPLMFETPPRRPSQPGRSRHRVGHPTKRSGPSSLISPEPKRSRGPPGWGSGVPERIGPAGTLFTDVISSGLAAPLGYSERVAKRKRDRGYYSSDTSSSSAKRSRANGNKKDWGLSTSYYMPFKRYKRRRYRRPVYKRRYGGGGGRTGGFMGFENKFTDQYLVNGLVQNALADAHVNPSGTVALGNTSQSDTENGRDGRHIRINQMMIRGQLVLDAANAEDPPQGEIPCRIMLIQDTQTNQATMTADSVFKDGSAGKPTIFFRDLEHAKRFRILFDRTYKVKPSWSAVGTVTSSDRAVTSVPFSIYKRLNVPVHYKTGATTAVTSGINDNSFHLFAIADEDAKLKISYASRTRFTK